MYLYKHISPGVAEGSETSVEKYYIIILIILLFIERIYSLLGLHPRASMSEQQSPIS